MQYWRGHFLIFGQTFVRCFLSDLASSSSVRDLFFALRVALAQHSGLALSDLLREYLGAGRAIVMLVVAATGHLRPHYVPMAALAGAVLLAGSNQRSRTVWSRRRAFAAPLTWAQGDGMNAHRAKSRPAPRQDDAQWRRARGRGNQSHKRAGDTESALTPKRRIPNPADPVIQLKFLAKR